MFIKYSLAAVMMFGVTTAHAEFVYTPISPSFGGNPQNTSHLLGVAGAQKTATATDVVVATDPTETETDTSNDAADLFIRQLQGRLLSALASQVTESIFGSNPQNNGTITFGDSEITFDRSNGQIALTISDFADGTVTEIIVPQLVTN